MTVFDPTQPFVLLDDARPGGGARLFTGLAETIVAAIPVEVAPALARLRGRPRTFAGFLTYEAGHALEPRLAALAHAGDPPLLWFGAFDHVQTLDAAAVAALADGRRAAIGPAVPAIAEAAYRAAVARALTLIAAGDIYQVNLTFPATAAVAGHPLAVHVALRARAAAPFSAIIHTGEAWVLSYSPELFFTLAGDRLTARPMKGTATRAPEPAADAAAAAALAADPKNRAENLMIVDLLRNDLARVAVPGSVAVPRLFEIETYPTVHQLTSTVSARARPGVAAADTLVAIFPCGSVTGAPKIRAMEVIADLEPEARGLYTGSIGVVEPSGDAAFSVAIRTLVMSNPGAARLGLGAGIVADSDPAAEWRECLAKAAFLTAPRRDPDLIETMRCEPATGISFLDRHLARLTASAAFLGHRFDPAAARAALAATIAGLEVAARVRLLLSPTGALAVQLSPCPAPPPGPVDIAIVPLPVAPDDWRLRHKTSDRDFYDAPRRAAATFEVIFARPDGRLTEGSFTSLFVERDGRLLTPPVGDGLLPGVLRAELLASGRAVEAPLAAGDLAGGCYIGNSLRGLLPARLRA